MISHKLFRDVAPDALPSDTEYEYCNFARAANPNGTPVRLWPGDNTPRTFKKCNLTNCQPPPGSTIIGAPPLVVETGLPDTSETITVDGVVVHTKEFKKNIARGRINPDTMEFEVFPTPREWREIDR